MFSVLLPVWARAEGYRADGYRADGYGPMGVGLVGAAMGLGAAGGAVVMVAVGGRVPRRRTFLLCFLIAGAPRLAAMALGLPLPAVPAVVVVAGLAAGAPLIRTWAAMDQRLPLPTPRGVTLTGPERG